MDSEGDFCDRSRRHQCSLQIYDTSSSHGGREGGKEKERLPYDEEEISLQDDIGTF